MIVRMALIVVLALTGGCVTAPMAALVTPVTRADLQPYVEGGDRSVSGEAFLREATGRLRRCSGATVMFIPALPVVDEAMIAWRRGEEIDVSGLPFLDLPETVRTVECTSRGKFRMSGLPALDYWIAVPVRWVEVDRSSGLKWKRGGMLAARVSLREGSVSRLVVDNEDRVFAAEPYALTSRFTTACGCAQDVR